MASGKSDQFDVKLVTIAKRTKQDTETDDLGGALGIAIADRDSAKEENRHGIKHMGSLNMLRDWRKGQHPSEEVENLKDGLRNANLIRLLSEVFPEDDKGTAAINQSGGDQTINASGNAQVTGNVMTGSSNLTIHNYASGESSTSREKGRKRKSTGSSSGTKRKDSSPGPSTKNKKTKIDNTKVTDDVIDELAEDIGINKKLGRLGLKLGFKFPAMKIYNAKNRAEGDFSFEGTKEMLIDWRDGEGQGNASVLKKALEDSGLKLYAEKYFKDS